MKSRHVWIVALCASVACAVLPARAADGVDKKKDRAPLVKPAKSATPVSTAEKAEHDTLKLQAITERRTKAEEANSNLMKKFSETSDSTIKNTK